MSFVQRDIACAFPRRYTLTPRPLVWLSIVPFSRPNHIAWISVIVKYHAKQHTRRARSSLAPSTDTPPPLSLLLSSSPSSPTADRHASATFGCRALHPRLNVKSHTYGGGSLPHITYTRLYVAISCVVEQPPTSLFGAPSWQRSFPSNRQVYLPFLSPTTPGYQVHHVVRTGGWYGGNHPHPKQATPTYAPPPRSV